VEKNRKLDQKEQKKLEKKIKELEAMTDSKQKSEQSIALEKEVEALKRQIQQNREKRDVLLKEKEQKDKVMELEKRRLLTDLENLFRAQDELKTQIEDEEKIKEEEMKKLENVKKELEENLKKQKEKLSNAKENQNPSDKLAPSDEEVAKQLKDLKDLRDKLELEIKQREMGLFLLRDELLDAIKQEQFKEKQAKRREEVAQRKKEKKKQLREENKQIKKERRDTGASIDSHSPKNNQEPQIEDVAPPPRPKELPPKSLPPRPVTNEDKSEPVVIEETKYSKELAKASELRQSRETEFAAMNENRNKTKAEIDEKANKLQSDMAKSKRSLQAVEEGQQKDIAFTKTKNSTKAERKAAKQRIKDRIELIPQLSDGVVETEIKIQKQQKDGEKILKKEDRELEKYKKNKWIKKKKCLISS